jgi:hypothetical protein
MTGKFVVFVLGIVSSAACKQIYGVSTSLTVGSTRQLTHTGDCMERLGHLQPYPRKQLYHKLAGRTCSFRYCTMFRHGWNQSVRKFDTLWM